MGVYAFRNISLSGPASPPNGEFVVRDRHGRYKGQGSPEGRVLGYVGDSYLNTDTGDEWQKVTGELNSPTKTGWEQEDSGFYTQAEVDALIATVPSGGTIVGSPEGIVTAVPTSLRIDNTDPLARQIWIKASGTGNTGWVEFLTI